jgi:hypothetical protein
MFVDDLMAALAKVATAMDEFTKAIEQIFKVSAEKSRTKTFANYGKHKHKQREKAHLYKCDIKPRRNLPYQRRSY